MLSNWDVAAGALGIDAMVGDPPSWPHPVRVMGAGIAAYERRFNRPDYSPRRLRIAGAILAFLLPTVAGGAAWGLVWVASYLYPPLGWMVAIALTASTIAYKGLFEAGAQVREALSCSLPGARRAIGEIVGRDTDALSEPEVVRAAVETLAENIVDGILAPLFYTAIGGAAGAMAYRAVNTLDSMVGYRSVRYKDFGWASARLDDLVNYLPARMTALLIWLILLALRLNPRRAWRTMRKDAKKHPSPNSGISEALMAGALGVRLGGLNYYGGEPSHRAELGEPLHPLEVPDITRTMSVVRWTSILAGLLLLLIGALTQWGRWL